MPVGPSHSRSGGGSRSFGGGGFRSSGSFRGSSFGGSSRGHHVPVFHRRPIRMHLFGTNVIVTTGRQSILALLFVFIFIGVFACFITSSIKNNLSEEMQISKGFVTQCEIDAEWYADAKIKAESGNYEDFFITTATYIGVQRIYYNHSNPTGYYYDNDLDVRVNNIPYFYLIYQYEVPEDNNGDGKNDVLEGETYSSFSSSQAAGWDKKIIVGKDNGSWASINYSYTLATNMEYQNEKNIVASYESSITSFNIAFVISVIVVIGLVIALVLVIVNTIKKGKKEYEQEQQKKEAEVAEARAKSVEAERKAKQINRHCAYCGSSVPDGESNCPSCGSAKFK